MKPISNSVMYAVGDLVDCVVQTHDVETLGTYIMDNKETITNALQLFGDTNSEPLFAVFCFTLWKVCPPEEEDHVEATKSFFLHIVQMAWEHYEQDCSKALDVWLETVEAKPSKKVKKVGQLPTTPDKGDVEHLKRCLEVS
jgi:hypothetical protein